MTNFDYRGLSSEELLRKCGEEDLLNDFAKGKFRMTECYSQGRIYREYARFSKWKSICIYSEHGIEFDVVGEHEFKNKAAGMFVFSENKLQNYRKVSDKPAYKVFHPFVWYRREHNIQKDKHAKGTIAFPAHSTPDHSSVFDVEQYIAQLKSLPNEMQPVCVCMFMLDVLKGRHHAYMANGIPVYTAGHIWDIRFVDRYYDILRRFKYATSNLIGSYTFYSVEMGIPFSLYGEPSMDFNEAKQSWRIRTIEQMEIAKQLFSGIHLGISEQQKAFVTSKLNIDDHISREEMRDILTRAHKQRGNILRDIIRYNWRKLSYYRKVKSKERNH